MQFLHSLHSTMFLLNPTPSAARSVVPRHFTFHDVSIKSEICFCNAYLMYFPLHSTMFLLNHWETACQGCRKASLHSTMFLLNHLSPFHLFVPIQSLHSTMFLLNQLSKTQATQLTLLYIPRCFY